jgi:site-specific DNA-adenine methylase
MTENKKVALKGLSYLGSKRKYRKQIFDRIIQDGDIKLFIDVFGGGGSMSLYADYLGITFIYNDINPLLKEAIELSAYDRHRWISRQEFKSGKLNNIMLNIWSFGNKGNTYM